VTSYDGADLLSLVLNSIIKEHTTIQARAACELSAQRRIALSGTPLQNSLNDLFSLVRFLRLEPFTDRSVWTQHIGALVKSGNNELGIERLQFIMRYLTLRRTKESTDKDGKPILALPPVSHRVIKLKLDPAEEAFYWSHHQRYKHAFLKLEETDSVMKNFCSILQEILRLRQICVHMALVKDSQDLGGDLISTIEKHGISKPRAIQLLSLMREAGAATCVECGVEMLASNGQVGEQEEDVKPDLKKKAPAKRARKPATSTSASASASALNSEDEIAASVNSSPGAELHSVVTRCQHLFCRACFASHVYPGWPNKVVADDRASCSVCRGDLTPALDAVEVGANEFEKAVAAEEEKEDVKPGRGGGQGRNGAADKKGKATTRFFEHSTKTK
jgi:SWI/SNF-related matrix-associated actin-dependent regulator of chromatin subfamily A3